MLVKIDGKCRITSTSGLQPMSLSGSQENMGSELLVYGEILGAVCEGKVLYTERVIQRLFESVDEAHRLYRILRCAVGDFILFQVKEDQVDIFTTTGSAGFFYTVVDNQLILSDEEDTMMRYVRDGELNEYELIDRLITPRYDGGCFETIYKECQWIPGGQTVSIRAGFQISHDTYLRRTTEEIRVERVRDNDAGYREFISVLEGMAKLVAMKRIEQHMLLGGIDSAAISIALLKAGVKVSAITYAQAADGSYDGTVKAVATTKRVGGILGIPVEVMPADRYSMSLRTLRDCLATMSCVNMCRWDSYLYYRLMEHWADQDIQENYQITGNEMDDGYGIAITKGGFDWRKRRAWNRAAKRFTYTKVYQDAVVGRYGLFGRVLTNEIRARLGSSMVIPASLEYILSLGVIYFFNNKYAPVVPSAERILPQWFSSIVDDYMRYKIDSFIKPILGQENYTALETESVTGIHLNHLIRLTRHYYSIPNVLKARAARRRVANFIEFDFPVQGPMVDFFLRFQMSVPHIFSPKRFLYRYFREETGKDYHDVVNAKNGVSKIIKEIQPGPGHTSAVGANLTKFMASRAFLQDVLGLLHAEDSVFLDHLQDGLLKEYVLGMFWELDRGVGELDFNKAMNLYNMELFFRNLYR